MKIKDMKIKRMPVFRGEDEVLLPADLKKKDSEGYTRIKADEEEWPLIQKWVKNHPESDDTDLAKFVNELRKLMK